MKLLISIFTLIFSFNSMAATCSSLGNGAWDDPLNWSCGVVPGAGDSVIINVGDTVILSTTEVISGPPMIIVVNGFFLFDTPSAKLHLPCGSQVIITPTGQIASSGVGQPSHNIKICGDFVWEGSDGPLTGPVILVGPGPLPIELVYFSASINLETISFEWMTASEINNDFFTLEGSINGSNWNLIETISGELNSTTNIIYNREFNNREDEFIYFRLKQTDLDGKYDYSDVITAEREKIENFRMYPNPLKDRSLKINVDSELSYSVMIFNLSGAIVYELKNIETREIWINDLDVPSGIYMVSVQTSNDQIVNKLVIE